MVKYTPLESVGRRNRFIAQHVRKDVEPMGYSNIAGGSVLRVFYSVRVLVGSYKLKTPSISHRKSTPRYLH